MPFSRPLRALLLGVTFGIVAFAGWLFGASGSVGALLGVGSAGLGFLVGRVRRRGRTVRSTPSSSHAPAASPRSPPTVPPPPLWPSPGESPKAHTTAHETGSGQGGGDVGTGGTSRAGAPGRGGVAHDLNNVLTTINGYADLLMASLPAGHPALDDAMQIRMAAMEGAELTDRLLTHDSRAGPDGRSPGQQPPGFAPQDPGGPGHAGDPEAWGSGRTVLVVEDDDTLLMLADRILSLRGYHVLTAADGPSALDLVERLAPTIDLVLCDVVLPGMSGPDTVKQLRLGGRRFRVLYMSGYTPAHLRPYGVLGEGIDMLSKPFHPDALVERVREVLEAPDPTVQAPPGGL